NRVSRIFLTAIQGNLPTLCQNFNSTILLVQLDQAFAKVPITLREIGGNLQCTLKRLHCLGSLSVGRQQLAESVVTKLIFRIVCPQLLEIRNAQGKTTIEPIFLHFLPGTLVKFRPHPIGRLIFVLLRLVWERNGKAVFPFTPIDDRTLSEGKMLFWKH